jgi:cell division protein FtsB
MVLSRPRHSLRWFALALLTVSVVLQIRLWTGTGGMPEVWRLQARVADQRAENDALAQRNDALAADVADLKDGREAVEERARSELGMTRPAEVFYQVIEKPAASAENETENR